MKFSQNIALGRPHCRPIMLALLCVGAVILCQMFFATARADAAAPILVRTEESGNLGVQAASMDIPAGLMGQTITTVEKWRAVRDAGGGANWRVTYLSTAANLTSGANTLAMTNLRVENAPELGTWTTPSTATWRTIQSGINSAVITSGYFKVRVIIPAGQAAGVYAGAGLRFRLTNGTVSNTIDVPVTVTVNPTLLRGEDTANPGVQVPAITLPTGVKGETKTSPETFRHVIAGSTANWTASARMTGNLMDGATSLASTAIYAENAPLLGTYQSLGTTWRNLQTTIPMANTVSGAWHLRVVIPTTQANGTYVGTLQIRVTTSGTSNTIDIPVTVNVINTVKQMEKDADPGTSVTAYTLPEGDQNTTQTSTDTFNVLLNGTYANWTLQVRMAANLTNPDTGVTLPATAIYAENAPLLGTYQSLGTTFRNIQAAIPMAQLRSGSFHLRVMIPAGQRSGAYTGNLEVQITNGTTSNVLSIPLTVEVTASIAVNCISSIANNCATPVTGFSFAETAPGNTSAAMGPYYLNLTSTSGNWATLADVTTTFEYATTGATMPASAIEVQGVDQGAGWANLGSTVNLRNNIINSTLNSGAINMRFSPPAGQDSGVYQGVITLTATTL